MSQNNSKLIVLTLLQTARVLRSTSTLTPPLCLLFLFTVPTELAFVCSVQEHSECTPVWQVGMCVLALSTLGQHLSIHHLPLYPSLHCSTRQVEEVFVHSLKLWLSLASTTLWTSLFCRVPSAHQEPTAENFSTLQWLQEKNSNQVLN